MRQRKCGILCMWPEQHRWTWGRSGVSFTLGIQRLRVCTCAVAPAAEHTHKEDMGGGLREPSGLGEGARLRS